VSVQTLHPAALQTAPWEVLMEDNTPKTWSSPAELRVPLDHGMLEVAKRTYQDNRDALWTHVVSTGFLVGDSLELRANLISLLVQIDEIAISWLDHTFGVNGREAWDIAQTEPIFLFWCLSCQEQIHPKGPMHMRRLKRELEVLRDARVGEMVSTGLLCGGCTELRLHLYNEECRAARLAQQARTAQLRKMTFAEYRVQPEWQQRRVQALTRAEYKCQMCPARDTTLDVHHNNYERYGNESPQDLVVLCRACHQKVHGIVEDAS
jgi:5-methylcytosine-specific restriction endonuclease McrA